MAVIGLIGALWAASGYIGAFIRASNAIYEMPEGRPVWTIVPLRVGLTLAVVILLATSAVGVVATGTVADRAGQMLGIGSTGVLVWDIAKWPVIAALVTLVFTLLYWASPNGETSRVPLAEPRAGCSLSWSGSWHRPDSLSAWPISARTTKPTVRWGE